MDFSVIVLTDAGDFLLETGDQLSRENRGVVLENAYIFNEDELAQEIQAERVFVPYSSIENIQYGDFEHETA